MYNVYICVWGYSYRLRPSTLLSERVSQINKNQIKWKLVVTFDTTAKKTSHMLQGASGAIYTEIQACTLSNLGVIINHRYST